MDTTEDPDTPEPAGSGVPGTTEPPASDGTNTSPELEAYMTQWQNPLDLLALVTLWLVIVPAFTLTSNSDTRIALLGFRFALSAVYAVDIIHRSRLAPRHWRYFTHHPAAIATVFIPSFRVILSLRVIRTMFQRGNIVRFVIAASLLFANLTVIVYFFERHAANGNIKTLGQAIWWAFVTVATVGYGDYTPVTVQGRIAAVVMMGLGFIVLATITAQISSAFIDQAARQRRTEQAPAPAPDPEMAERLRRIDAVLGSLAQPGD